jgi:alpha-galactosidase
MTRIVLVGAGSAQFGLGTLADIFRSDVLTGSTIVLHDINPASLARVHRIGQEHIQAHKLDYCLEATTDRRAALQGADFCIISIEVGDRFKLWEQDWKIPLQYGFRQVYGENGGPGGLFHALRITPPILAICRDVMELCPDAWVLNFSNPMSRICTTVTQALPELHLVGLCHEIQSVERHLPEMLGCAFADLEVVAGGLNHFSILLEARFKATGQDAYPDIRAKAPGYFEARERGLFMELLRRFGYLPITTDSHMGEYIQWAHDVVDHEGILQFYAWYKEYAQARAPQEGYTLEQYQQGEQVVPIIEAIVADTGLHELAVNLPNDNLIEGLPGDIVVEAPALVDGRGVHGLRLEGYPKGFLGLLQNQVAVHELTAEAVLTGSKAAALQALLVDPVVDKVAPAEQMLETILLLQSQYLGYIR